MDFIKIKTDASSLSEILEKWSGENLLICPLGKVAICERWTKPSNKVFRQRIAYFYDPDGNDVPAERTEFTDGDGEEFRYAIASVPPAGDLYAMVEFEFCDELGSGGFGAIYLKFWKENDNIKVRWLDPEEVPFLVPDDPDDWVDDLDDPDDFDDDAQE